jgi:hypothetical protein
LGAIVDVFDDVVDSVTDTISDVISWVGDTVADAGDWVVDEIVSPVVDAVDDVIAAVKDDPLKAIATAIASYYAPWAIPLIEGADVAQNGGDIGDILEASAKAYVGQQIGSYAGSYASGAASTAGASATAATIIGTASGAGASALVTGQDPVQAFLTGGIQAGVNAGLGYIDSQISGTETGTGTGTGTETGTGVVAETKGFLDQNPTVKNVISASLTAALSGKEITGDVIMGAVIKGKITTETVQSYLDTDNSLNEAQLAALTSTIQNVTNATFSGADVSDALYASLNTYGTQELNKIIDKNVKNTIDKVTGDYQKLEGKAEEITSVEGRYKGNADKYNNYVNSLEGMIKTRNSAKAEVDRLRGVLQANAGQPDAVYGPIVDAYNNAVDQYNRAATNADKYYSDFFTGDGEAATLKASLDSDYSTMEKLTAEYQTFKDTLVSSADQLDDVLAPVSEATQKAYVRAMTDDEFNVEEYKNVNGLSNLSDDEARYHWLTEGKENNLPVNAAQYKTEFDNAVTSSMQGTLESLGLSIADLTPEQIKSLREQTLAYGEGNLQLLRDIKNSSAAIATTFRDNIGKGAVENAEELIGGTSPEQLQNLLDAYQVSSYDKLPDDVKTKITNAALEKQTKQNIIKPADVSDADILNGNAKVNTNADGLLEWGKIDVVASVPKWSSKYGQIVTETERYNGSYYERTVTGFKGDKLLEISGFPDENGTIRIPETYFDINDPERTKIFNESGTVGADGALRIALLPTTVDLSHLKETNAGSYLDTLSDMSAEAVQEAVQAGVTGLQQQYEFAKNVAAYVASTEIGQDIVEAGASIANSDFGKNTAGVVLDAGGELLDSMNNLVLIAGINPESTPLGKTAKNLIAMAGDMKTEDYKAAAEEIQKTIGNANFEPDKLPDGSPNPKAGQLLTNPDGTPLSTWAKAKNTILAIGGAAMDNPGTFLSEYVAKELLQEIPILVASGGTANVVKAGLKQAGEEFAQKMGQRAALGTAGTLDVAESFGGTAGGAYDDAYATALKSGMSDAEAQEYALDKAITAGTISAVTTIGTMGIGGNDFEKAIFNGKRGKSFSEAFDTVAKEAAQETVEEGLPQAYLESQLYQLDPTRDVVGNVVSNSVLGALSGGSTAGSIYGGAATGDVVSNALVMFNSDVRNIVQNEGGLDAAGVTQQLNDLGISDNTIQSNILNQVFDTDYTSTGEAEQAAYDYATENNIQYKFTKDELTDFTGANADADLAALVDNFVDPRYLDAQEIIDAAATEGVTLTEEQAQQYVSQTDEAAGVTNIKTEYDPQGVIYSEAEQYLTDLGYNPTEDEINSFVEQISETEQQQAVGEYVDPRMTSTEEATEFLTSLGYDPTEQEIAQFVGQYGEEAQQAAIDKYVDPRLVTEEEVYDAYSMLGLSDVLEGDVTPLVGQYAQEELLGKLEEALPDAQFNVLQYKLGNPSTDGEPATGIYAELEQLINSGVAQDDAIQQISDDLTSSFQELQDAGLTQDQAINQLGDDITGLETALGTDIQSIADIIGKPATEVTDVDVDFVADLIAQQEALADPSTFEFTDAQLQYDVTGDGIVDINDQNLLNNAIQGQDVTFAPDSQFESATGIFAQLDAQTQAQMDAQAQIQAQLDAQAQAQLDAQLQLSQQVEDEALENRRLGNLRSLQGLMAQDSGRMTQVKAQPVAKIGPAYDFQSIFRDPSQESFYRSPYAEGGVVKTNEELLKLLGGK